MKESESHIIYSDIVTLRYNGGRYCIRMRLMVVGIITPTSLGDSYHVLS